MRYKVFLDTNILLSGIFFEGNEAKILDLVEIQLITCDNVIAELREVVSKKLRYLKDRTLEIALLETERAISDIEIIPEIKYKKKIKEAEALITHKKDSHILAAVLYAKPDFLITGDSHFFTERVKKVVRVINAKELLDAVKKKPS
jgi:putative PIN family toxin of toxin-antitoxin system